MGNLRKYEGEITITPPLNWAEIKKAQEQSHIKNGYEITMVVEEVEEDNDLGTSVVKTCSSLVPFMDSFYKGYNVEEAVRQVVKACPQHTFDGYFEGVLEDGSAMWRIVAKDRTVTEIRPDISWPMP